MWIDDQVLNECEKDLCLKLWVPTDPVVVLGRSNRVSVEVNGAACERDAVPILKRLGGGGTVVLHAGCLIVSCGLWVRDYYKNDLYFRLMNQSVIDVLETKLSPLAFAQRGFSDIVQGDKKVAGTSLFRSRHFLLYQASILVDAKIELIEAYLRHPSLEPDYRQGRTHRDFVSDLNAFSAHTAGDWMRIFEESLGERILANFEAERISAVPAQQPHIKGRIGEVKPLDF